MRTLLHHAAADDAWLVIPGQWRSGTRDGRRTATVSCPDCGRSASLSDHEIRADGTVTPSLVCPFDDCDFHAWVKLEGWRP